MEEAVEVPMEDGPTSATDSSDLAFPHQASWSNVMDDSTFKESRDLDVASSSQNRGEVRGGVCGCGHNQRQKGGGFSIRVLALLQEVWQERRSLDAFLDPGNPCACFCLSLYHILEDIGGDHAITMQYRHAKLSGTPPPPRVLYGCFSVSLNGPGTSAVLAAPSQYQPPPQCQLPPTQSQTSFYPLAPLLR